MKATRKIKAAVSHIESLFAGNERHVTTLAPFNIPVKVTVCSGEWSRWFSGTYADGSCAFAFGIDHGYAFDRKMAYEAIQEA